MSLGPFLCGFFHGILCSHNRSARLVAIDSGGIGLSMLPALMLGLVFAAPAQWFLILLAHHER